jgi:hypothetical protein
MLNISKYHKAIIGCSAIATASFVGVVQSANAEQINSTVLIAQVNDSNPSGTNVTTTPIGITSGSNATGGNTGSYSAGTISRAGAIQSRFSTAVSNYANAKAAVGNASNQPTSAVSEKVRYARSVDAAATCGCPNADTVGGDTKVGSASSPALEAAKLKEAEAATELASAQAEADKFIETVKTSSSNGGVSSPIW